MLMVRHLFIYVQWDEQKCTPQGILNAALTPLTIIFSVY